MVVPPHFNLNLVRSLPDRPYSVLSSPTEANRKPEDADKRGTVAYTLAKKNAQKVLNQQQQYQQQQSYFNSPNSSLRSNSHQDEFEQESLAENVYGSNEARDLNERRNRYSHGRTGSMGSVKIITANHINKNNNNNNNNTSLRSIRDGIDQGLNGRNLNHRRSSSTPKRFQTAPNVIPLFPSSSNSSQSTPKRFQTAPNVIPLFPSSSNSSQSKLVILPSLTNANGASPSTLRIVKPAPEPISGQQSIAFNDSPISPPATIIFSETTLSTNNNTHQLSTSTTTAQFRCHLIQTPSTYSIQSSSNASLLVNLNIGGTKFTTTAATLVRKDGKGGKLGEFVASVLEDAKKDSRKKKSGLKDLVMSRKDSMESAYPETSVPSSPPPPSPFSYDQYAENFDDDELDRRTSISLDMAAFDPSNLPDSPTVVDPFRLTRPIIPFVKPPSALSIPTTQPLRPFNNLLNAPINPDDFGEIEDWTPKGTNHFSTYNQENNPFERALGPYFEVMKGQQKKVGAGGKVVERESSGIPVDVESRMEEEEAVRKQAIEGILRGKDASKATRKSYAISKSKNHKSTRISNFMPNFLPPPPMPAQAMEIFLDRPGEIYSAILSYLRDENLPSDLIIPFTSNINDPAVVEIDSTTLAIFRLNPSAALLILASLRTLAIEASYLGMKDLGDVVESERQKVVELIKILEGGSYREDKKRKEMPEIKKERSKGIIDKANWI